MRKIMTHCIAAAFVLSLCLSGLAFGQGGGQVTKTQPEGGEPYPNTTTAQNPATMAGQKVLKTPSQKAKKKAHEQHHQQKLQQEGQTPMAPGQ